MPNTVYVQWDFDIFLLNNFLLMVSFGSLWRSFENAVEWEIGFVIKLDGLKVGYVLL